MNDDLVNFIKECVLHEISKIKEVDVPGGIKLPYGSPEHIEALKSRIEYLESWRDLQPIGSEMRGNHSRIISRLRRDLCNAIKANSKLDIAQQ